MLRLCEMVMTLADVLIVRLAERGRGASGGSVQACCWPCAHNVVVTAIPLILNPCFLFCFLSLVRSWRHRIGLLGVPVAT